MVKKVLFIIVCIMSISFYSCSKKTTPSSEKVAASPETKSPVSTDSALVKKVMAKPRPKPVAVVPKVIVVSDAGAKKSVDGRMYYDMQGRRYWRNNKDGKYYLYNKSMHADPAFKVPAKKA